MYYVRRFIRQPRIRTTLNPSEQRSWRDLRSAISVKKPERERDGFDYVDRPRRRRLSAIDNLLYSLSMFGEIKMHDVVSLLQDVPAKHFESGRALLLRRGQVGTVVMNYPDGAYEVEFADRDGRAFAILSLRGDQLMVLHDAPDFAAA